MGVKLRKLTRSLAVVYHLLALTLTLIFRFYLPLKLARWRAARRFKKILVEEGLPREVAEEILEEAVLDPSRLLTDLSTIRLRRRVRGREN